MWWLLACFSTIESSLCFIYVPTNTPVPEDENALFITWIRYKYPCNILIKLHNVESKHSQITVWECLQDGMSQYYLFIYSTSIILKVKLYKQVLTWWELYSILSLLPAGRRDAWTSLWVYAFTHNSLQTWDHYPADMLESG